MAFKNINQTNYYKNLETTSFRLSKASSEAINKLLNTRVKKYNKVVGNTIEPAFTLQEGVKGKIAPNKMIKVAKMSSKNTSDDFEKLVRDFNKNVQDINIDIIKESLKELGYTPKQISKLQLTLIGRIIKSEGSEKPFVIPKKGSKKKNYESEAITGRLGKFKKGIYDFYQFKTNTIRAMEKNNYPKEYIDFIKKLPYAVFVMLMRSNSKLYNKMSDFVYTDGVYANENFITIIDNFRRNYDY